MYGISNLRQIKTFNPLNSSVYLKNAVYFIGQLVYDISIIYRAKEIKMQIGDRVKAIRVIRKISMRKLSKLSKVPNSTISDIENNKVDTSAITLQKLATALGVSIDDLFKPEPMTENEHNKEIINNEGIRRIERARNKMPLKEKEKMMKILEASFEDYFDEED